MWNRVCWQDTWIAFEVIFDGTLYNEEVENLVAHASVFFQWMIFAC